MDVSKLSINPDHLRFKKLTPERKSELRRENIKALIRSKPAGTIITAKEFTEVTKVPGTGIFAILNSLIKKGEITKIPAPGFTKKSSWVVNESREPVPQPANRPATRYTVLQLTQLAKDFTWDTESDSLREFINKLTKENQHGNR